MVYLVGAGPGDPGLITVKGLACIQQADVIVYDRLVAPELLSQARTGAELIFAGKGNGWQAMSQDEISALLVRRAREGRTVCRLKGGDPFVFGRGGEEAEELRAAGIAYEVVPGVTSAIAAPAYAGIPVTYRNVSTSFAVVTCHTESGWTNAVDWAALAPIGTLVCLMGMAQLEQVCAQLVANGRALDTPVAVVQWGTTTRQRVCTGTLSNIGQRAREQGLGAPAAIVVGEVVGLRDRIAWFVASPEVQAT